MASELVPESIFLAKGWRLYKIFNNSQQKSKVMF